MTDSISLDKLATSSLMVRKMAEAALLRNKLDSERASAIRAALLGDKGRGWIEETVPLVVADEDSAEIAQNVYAVRIGVNQYASEADALWTTVVHGVADRVYFRDRWTAVLHAIAQVHGPEDSHGGGAFCAARVLGITPAPGR